MFHMQWWMIGGTRLQIVNVESFLYLSLVVPSLRHPHHSPSSACLGLSSHCRWKAFLFKKCSLQSSAFHSYFLLQKFREACKETSANSLVKYWQPHHHPPTQSSTFNKQKRTIPITQDENQQLINLTSIIIMFRNFFSGWCETNCDRNFLGLPHSCTLDLSGHRWKRKNILEQPIFTFARKITQKPIFTLNSLFSGILALFLCFPGQFFQSDFCSEWE